MKTFLKLSIASALAMGAVTANATVSLPSTGSSDLVLFVQDVTTGESYARDLGITVGSALAGPFLPAGTNTSVPSTTLSANFTVTADANMTTFLSTVHAGDIVQYAVMGAATPVTQNSAQNVPVGAGRYITTNGTGDALSNVTGKKPGNIGVWGSGLQRDLGLLNANLGSANSVVGASAATAGIYDANATGAAAWNWYLNGPVNGVIGLGTPAFLYGVTGNGATLTNVQTYQLATLTLAANGTLTAVGNTPPSAVPLPAAVWLLGSGLLGLAGVGRRKAAKV
jgi:hypothetical protein